ncbi:MAG: hypothetical protein Sylvanvirus1_13 [Sylvanvirus sp.]|uniref:ERCC4 domain-containing protein EP364R n=1 Tax=Sylvanvirus sp. TaxID=2487774 RepID=A0A3G5AGV7_9VIRU|nr:MAG: hypothetical protein Sylvanvirus1_13 [Sylvanvirus sp.]
MDELTLLETLYGHRNVSQLSWFDQVLLPEVMPLYAQVCTLGDECKKYNIEFRWDGREKKNMKTVLSTLPMGRLQSEDEGDYRLLIGGHLFMPIERKLTPDLLGSIGHRSNMQQAKMSTLCVPHDHKFYLIEQVSKSTWKQYINHQGESKGLRALMGARVNLIFRNNFRVLETQSILDTFFLFLMLIQKAVEHRGILEQRMNAWRVSDSWNTYLKSLTMEELFIRSQRSTYLWWKQTPEEGGKEATVNIKLSKSNELDILNDLNESNDLSDSNDSNQPNQSNSESSSSNIRNETQMAEQWTSAVKHQHRMKKRKVEQQASDQLATLLSSGTGLCVIQNPWIMQLSQIPKMGLAKAQAVAALYPTLVTFVHAAEDDRAGTWKQLSDLNVDSKFDKFKEGSTSNATRRLGPAMATSLLTWVGLTYEKPVKAKKTKLNKE